MSTELAGEVITGWAGFDQATGDDPHPLYARVRAEAPARPVLLADGRAGVDRDRLRRGPPGAARCRRGVRHRASRTAGGPRRRLRRPDQLDRLRADLSPVPQAVEEFLRYDGPVQHTTFRMTTEPVTVGGMEIPAHEQVLVVLPAANRDPSRFPEADTLDVGRVHNRHVAFGHGIHFCLGAPLARLEGEVAFTSLLQRFPDLRLAVPPDQLHWTYRLVPRTLSSLPVLVR